ncbi:hypothetical protein [Paenibacillus pedocola]|uniref:hypothetical protein n=1 Tax=Paenibacillus pedocola TaxID=3242193 RepID=UPI002877992D|nr:hypothetical protein [Paenibacillus typhae]
MNFIPIKFAIQLDEAQKTLKKGRYICVTESKYVLDTGWSAKTSINTHLERDLAVRVSMNSPNKYLSDKEFDFKWYELANEFLLSGRVERYEEDSSTNVLYADLEVDKWNIIYPIKRTTYNME